MNPRPPPSAESDAARWLRLEPLLDAWIDASHEAEKEALLASVRESDPALSAELEEMLGLLSTDGDRLERPLGQSAADLLERIPNELGGGLHSTRRGQLLGQYRLLEVLARGGMGVVYIAERADGQFEKRVAVKLLPAGLESQETELRFLTERQILANLEHPNIARLLDGGLTDEGYPYLVMELVDGERIDVHCADYELGLDARLHLFLQVCDAVQHAHQHMVIHRDLKPSNILVTPEGEVKLLDFGIARLEDPAVAGVGAATVFQPRSLRYAAPEQVANRPVSTASDVYALGVVLYELLAESPPFDLDGLSPTEIELTIREKAPEPPSGRASDWKRRLAGDLDNIVLKALCKDPGQRYGSATELADDLRRFLGGLPVGARPSSRRYRTAKFVARNRVGVSVAALILVLSVASIVAILRQSQVAALERDRAERAANFVLEFMTIPDPDRGGGTTITSRELLDQARLRAEGEFSGQPELQARVLTTIAEGYYNLGVFDVAAELQAVLVALLEPTKNRVQLANAHMALGSALGYDGFPEAGIGHLETAIEMYRRELGEESLETATALGRLADVIAVALPPTHPQSERLRPLLQQAIEIHYKIGTQDHPELASHLHLLGQVSFGRAFVDAENRDLHVADGEGFLREALVMRRRLFGDRAFPVAETLNDLGLGIDSVGRPEEALVMLAEALEIHREVLGEEHPDSLHMLNNVAAMHRDAGEYAKALPLYRECLEQWEKIHPDDDRQMWAPLYGLGSVLVGLGRLDEAEVPVRRLLTAVGDESDDLRAHLARGVLGEIQTQRGRFDQAERLLVDAYEAMDRQLAPSHPEILRVRSQLVALYESWGRAEDADRYREGSD